MKKSTKRLLSFNTRRSGAVGLCKMLLLVGMGVLLAGCQGAGKPITTVEQVDLQRFTGDWYVIAAIPTFIETEAFNAVETYALDDQGRVPTTFRFNKGGFDGPVKEYHPMGFVREGTGNAVWGMQFIWPIKAEYRIVYLDEDYSRTIIGRTRRDYVWLMARTPQISDKVYAEMVDFIEAEGYDSSQLRKVPQRW